MLALMEKIKPEDVLPLSALLRVLGSKAVMKYLEREEK